MPLTRSFLRTWNNLEIKEHNMPAPKKSLPAKKMPETYTDQEVVSAFNSCLDLVKWNNLPNKVKDRLKALYRHNRLRMVCFFNMSGFGIRVYKDIAEGNLESGGDVLNVTGNAVMELDGIYIDCPKTVWEDRLKKVVEPPPEPKYLIMDETGTKYLESYIEEVDEEADDEVSIEDVDWSSLRQDARKFTEKRDANRIASYIKGVVVKE